MKIVLIVLVAITALLAQVNYSGWSDTAAVASFNGTDAGTTRAFELSQYEGMLFYAMANDTSSAVFATDSIVFQWGLEFLNVVKNSSGGRDTSVVGRILCDTFNIATAGNLVVPVSIPDTLGNYKRFSKFIDTIEVSGFAIQHSQQVVFWAPIFRFWYAGLTGNSAVTPNVLIFGQSRQLYTNVKNQ